MPAREVVFCRPFSSRTVNDPSGSDSVTNNLTISYTIKIFIPIFQMFTSFKDQNMNAVELKANILDINTLQKSIEFELGILGDFCKISIDSLLNNSTWMHLKITWTSKGKKLTTPVCCKVLKFYRVCFKMVSLIS
jgi:hypothetical protein